MTTESDGDIRKEESIQKDFVSLFVKIKEHEIELERLEKH